MKVEVPVTFDGMVIVEVPEDTPCPEALAQNKALARVLATLENEDAPDDDAYDNYLDACEDDDINVDEQDAADFWEQAELVSIDGDWYVETEEAEEQG